jgi:hypothetical protein
VNVRCQATMVLASEAPTSTATFRTLSGGLNGTTTAPGRSASEKTIGEYEGCQA